MSAQNKTSKKKEEVKTTSAYNTGSYKVYYGYADCPHCNNKQYVEGEGKPPRMTKCMNQSCNKDFNIEWE